MPDINEPTEIAQELGEKLKVPNVEFDAWVASMPAKHWSKYDLSACRLGWEAGRRVSSAPSFADGIEAAAKVAIELGTAPLEGANIRIGIGNAIAAAIRALAHNPQASSGGDEGKWLGPYKTAAEALDDCRKAVATEIGADPETWPDHGNAALAIAATVALARIRNRSGAAEGNEAEAGPGELVEQIIAGTDPMSKWVGSVDYSTYADFEQYLKTQLREALSLKVSLEKTRKDSAEDESLATFVDGRSASLEAALVTFRTVIERENAARQEQRGAVEAKVDAIVRAIRPYTRETLFLEEHRALVRAALAATPVHQEAGE